ncbi:MAG: filamentous hemagglutinin N-terminal domain-containing protein [Negativicutes bacterium]|nr:filamentous hemagglutinin N-terminal domain-containing protein [Negativicutes bacterium]
MQRKWRRDWKQGKSRFLNNCRRQDITDKQKTAGQMLSERVISVLKQTTAAAAMLLLAAAGSVEGAPQGGQVAAGTGTVKQQGALTTIQQMTDKLAINWQSFDIAAQERVQFLQPSSGSVALNRVLGNNPTQIHGQLMSNGKVFLTNPNGILFGQGAQVDVGGIVASTLGISDSDFLAGRYVFSGNTGSVINQGNIQAADRGYIALLAPDVRNEGVIAARLGTVALGAGQRATLDFAGDGKLNLAVNEAAIRANVENKNMIQADGGVVILAARAKDALINTVVNNTGVIKAQSVSSENGVIRLEGGPQGVVSVSGTLDASGKNGGGSGGTVKVLGDKVMLAGSAMLDASGDKAGGTVLVGGNWQGKGPEQNALRTLVAPGAEIKADAITFGNGGKVVVWAEGDTRYYGNISAQGGAQSGDGGKAEVSGKQNLDFAGRVNLGAASGTAGVLLLDPDYIEIIRSGNAQMPAANGFPEYQHYPGTFNISAAAIADLLSQNAVELQAKYDITINDYIESASTNSLTMKAGRLLWLTNSAWYDDRTYNNGIQTSGDVRLYANHYFNDDYLRQGSNPGMLIEGDITANNLVLELGPNGPASGITVNGAKLYANNITIYSSTNVEFANNPLLAKKELNKYDGTYENADTVSIRALTNAFLNPGLIYSQNTLLMAEESYHHPTIFTRGTEKFWVSAGNSAYANINFNYDDIPKTYVRYGQGSLDWWSGFAAVPTVAGKQRYFLFRDTPVLTVKPADVTKTYGDAASLGYTITGLRSWDTFLNPFSGQPDLFVAGGGANAGIYTIQSGQGTLTSELGYQFAFNTGTLTVRRRPVTLTAGSATRYYGEPNPSLGTNFAIAADGVGTSRGLAPGDVVSSVANTVADTATQTAAAGTSHAIIPSNPVFASGSAANYDFTYIPGILTITKRPITVTPKILQSKIYGENDPVFSYNLAGGGGTTGPALVGADTLSGLLGRTAGENVGSFYTITQGSLVNANNPNYDIAFSKTPVLFAITPRPITIRADAKSKIYGEAMPYLSYTVIPGQGTTGNALVSGDRLTGGLIPTNNVNAGTYEIRQGTLQVADGKSSNYNISYIPAPFTILPRPITVRPDSGQTKIYGEADPILRYSVAGGAGTTGSALVNGDTLVGSLSRQAGNDVGSYAVTQGSLTSANNPNYNISFDAGAVFSITPRPVTITPITGQTKIYGEADPVLRYTVTGGPGTTGSAIVNGDMLSGGLSRESGENAGSYRILQGDLVSDGQKNANYQIQFDTRPVNFTVERRPITVKPADISREYGDNNPAFAQAVIKTGSLALGDTLTAVSPVATPAKAGSDTGVYSLSLQELALNTGLAANYLITYENGTLTVNKAPLVIKANDYTRRYGQPNPAFTAAYTGFKLSDTPADLGGVLKFMTDAGTNSQAGVYPIVPFGHTSLNYDIFYQNGRLTIEGMNNQQKSVYQSLLAQMSSVSGAAAEFGQVFRTPAGRAVTASGNRTQPRSEWSLPTITVLNPLDIPHEIKGAAHLADNLQPAAAHKGETEKNRFEGNPDMVEDGR